MNKNLCLSLDEGELRLMVKLANTVEEGAGHEVLASRLLQNP